MPPLGSIPSATVVALVSLLCLLTVPGAARAQEGDAGDSDIRRFPPPRGAVTHEAAPGERYHVGAFRRWFLGSGYRDVWTTPIEIPVLDLDTFAGGLTPVETGGYGQTITLELVGADGLEYAVRSLDKNPTRRLDPLLQNTVVAAIVQDQVAAFLPTAGLVVDPLLEAVGLLYPAHRLVIVPDDPRLGEFREDFAGLIGLLTDRPDEGPDDTPGFAGSTRIVGTDTFLDELEEGDCNRVDSREYLKARLVDMVIGDRDRHEGQWRWARYPDGEDCYVWRPIPEDRDQAFVLHNGFMMSLYRLVRPQQVKFGPRYPSLLGLTFNGWELDRQLFADLDEPVWAAVAEEIREDLTDSVIEAAVRRLPPEHYELVGEFLTESLKSRRDELLDEALDYYRMLSNAAEIKATDRDEHAVFEHLENGNLLVTITYRDGPRSDAPYYERTFRPSATDEVRLYLQGGDDLVEVRGADGDIKVRAIGGGGDDRFVNESGTGGGLTRFYDARGDNQFVGRAKVDEEPFERPPATNLVHRYALDWGHVKRFIPQLGYSPDFGFQVGLLAGVDRFGFRKVPWHSTHAIRGILASNGPDFELSYDGRFREVVGNADGLFSASYSGIELIRFHGFGNETETPGPASFYEVEQRQMTLAPALEFSWGRWGVQDEDTGLQEFRPEIRFGVGPVIKYVDTPEDDIEDRFLGTLDPAPLGLGSYGQIGARSWVRVDTRDRAGYPTRGFIVQAGGTFYPAMWDVEETFGDAHGSASLFLTPGTARSAPTLALRAGGKKVWGEFPFHEAAFLGGRDDLRGYREERFAGDAALYGNAEVRLPLTRFVLLFPTELGILGAADVGRVFFEDDPSGADTWHTGFGGGLWLSFLNRTQTFSITVMNGDDITGLYVKAGLHF